MSLDRVVRFCKKYPTKKEVTHFLEDYFGEGAKKIYWDKDRWFVVLFGKPSNAFERIVDWPYRMKEFMPKERWIEVWPQLRGKPNKCIYVMTRMADEYTNGLAADLADHFRRFWEGVLEE